MFSKKRKYALHISGFITFAVLLVYLYPASRLNGYIPYIIIGVMFLMLIIWNNFSFNLSYGFFLFTFYAFFSNLILYPVFLNSSVSKAVLTSLFLMVPFFSFQIGKIMGKCIVDYPFEKIAFILICVEFIVVVLQNTGGSLGVTLAQAFGGNKYSEPYFLAGSRIRCIGTIGNPNALGVFILVCMSIVLNKSHRTLIRILTLAFSSIIVIMTLSRTAFALELILLVLIYGRLFDSELSGKRRIRNLIIIIISIVLLMNLYTRYINREFSFASMGGRIDIWKHLIETIYNESESKIWLGTVFGRGVSYIKSLEDTDNEYLFLFLSTGVTGVMIWLSELLHLMRRTILIKKENKLICLLILVLWLISVVASSFYTNYLLSFFSFVFWGYSIERGMLDTV